MAAEDATLFEKMKGLGSEAWSKARGFAEGADPYFALGGALSLPILYLLLSYLRGGKAGKKRSMLSKLLGLGALAGAGGLAGAGAGYGWQRRGELMDMLSSMLGGAGETEEAGESK